ncbi:peptide transporter family 1-like isoform X2 [Dermacentor silvarum]|uniref:peptide transporter family 1-like isoform X2 n=1 Tax=Dermacentor silvarum TaxID=543639 RepID=UPI002101774C|nr:peptide transporter family 1-like isoform X2 [Dermacentor silvarum]
MQEPESRPYPKAVFFIIGNEFCERFSYYGMRTILTLFLINVLMFEEHTAKSVYHGFVMACYFSPVLGAMIADSYLGKFRTIFYISIVYAIGNITLAVSAVPALVGHTWIPMIGLAVIAFGTGGIKPCVSAFGGDQFMPGQERQLEQFFSLFYLSINAGSLLSTFITPILRVQRCLGQMFCFPLAFGVPAALMVLALVFFMVGKPLYRIVPPAGNVVVRVLQCIWKSLIADIKDVLHVLVLYAPLPVFWALFDQQGSQWTLQANKMDGEILGYQVLPDQMQLVNPLLILVLVPVFSYGVYPMFNRCNLLNRPLQKITVGGVAAAAAFAVAGCVDMALESGAEAPSPAGFTRVAFVNTLPCPVQVSGPQLELRLQPGMALSEPHVPRAAVLHVLALAPCTLAPAQLQAVTSGQVILLEDKQAVRPTLVPSTKASKSHNGQLLVAYTLQEPVAAVMFAGDSAGKTYSAAPVHTNSTSSFSNATGLTPGRYTARLLGSDDRELAACNVVVKNGGHYTLVVTHEASAEPNCSLHEIVRPNSLSMFYQIPQYVLITAGEVMFSVTGLEFSYSQAPSSMKSVLQAAWLLTVAVGNLIVVIIAEARFFSVASSESFMYSGLMTLDMVVFGVMACFYKYIKPGARDACEKPQPVSEGDTKM